MPPALLPIIVAAVAAGAILLIFLGLSGKSPVDPVQARLTQLGAMQAKNLEELELQQPFIERTLRPLAAAMSGRVSRMASSSFQEKAEKRLALAGNPGNLRVADWLGVKAVGAVIGAIIFILLFVIVGVMKLPIPINFGMGVVGLLLGYTVPEFWLGGRVRKRQHAILLQIPDALDLLTISVRAGLGFDAALGKVVEKLQGPLTEEFRRALAEVRVGKARREALRDIVPRTEVGAADELHRRDHPGRAARCVDLEGPPGPVRTAPHRAPPARRGAGREGADQDALPARRVHLPVALHRHPRAGHHPHHPEPDPERGLGPGIPSVRRRGAWLRAT